MTTSQKTTAGIASVGQFSCPHCKAALPPQATFCGSCGERLQKKNDTAPLDEQDIQARYRIKTLVRRFPHTNLYFALDNSQTQDAGPARIVAIRDIDVVGLDKENREQAAVLAQQEYDYLRRWNLPHTLACIDLRAFQGHLFLIAGFPNAPQPSPNSKTQQQRLFTLQDFLQSGLGLPRESRTLEWIRNLSEAVEHLHRHHIVLADLDPYTVVLDKNSAQAEPRLMPFWLWPDIQKLLAHNHPLASPQVSYFKAPEALAGKAGLRSDIYSLGALLYLLLTGTPPDESTLRHRRRLRTPREINSRISQHVDDCVMRALAVEPEERFPNIVAFQLALNDVSSNQPPRKSFPPPVKMPEAPLSDVETVRIVPLSQKNVQRWRSADDEHTLSKEPEAKLPRASRSAANLPTLSSSLPPPPTMPLATPEAAAYAAANASQAKGKRSETAHPALAASPPGGGTAPAGKMAALPMTPLPPLPTAQSPVTPAPLEDETRLSWPQRITGILPVIKAESPPKPGRTRRKKAANQPGHLPASAGHKEEISLLKQIQRMILGQQERSIDAAAIVETPLRVRPDQPYNLRLHIMGRDEPTPHPHAKKGAAPAGLSALVHGEVMLVEVRSVLQQGYTYVLQHASVTIPARGYAAEVTIPMQQQTITPMGRRDRLHIFFLDEHRQPLYEKPFVVEIFISPLVQFGREGHQVLTIPM